MEKKKRRYGRADSLVWALGRLWGAERQYVFCVFAAIPTAVLLPLAESFFTKVLLDNLGAGAAFGRLALLVSVFLAGILLLDILDEFVKRRKQGLQYYPTSVYQSQMMEFRDYKTDYENTERQDFKKVMQYALGDACGGNCALEYFGNDLSQALIRLCGIVTYAGLLVSLNPILFAVTAAVSAGSYFTTRWQPVYYEKNKHRWEKENRKKEYLNGLSEDFPRAKDIKLYGLEGWLEKMMRDYQAYIRMWNRRCGLRGFLAAVLSGLMALVQNGMAYFVLIGTLIGGEITVGDFVFYFGIVAGLSDFLQGIIASVAALNSRADKIAYYRELFDYPSRLRHEGGCPLPAAPLSIEFRDVWYRYDGAKEDTLKGINLTIEAGEKLALVGVNGAGKTTMVKLLCGLYLPTKGQILVGGRDIREYNIEEYFTLISAVFQEVRAVAFTMFEFVASSGLERPDARKKAEAAMKAAGIYEKIQGLPLGMDTHLRKGIYEDGVDFSGGEMQKLLLARAIYKDGPILILDEPTAALDPIAENRLYLQYRELTEHKTSLYISHRLASTRFCDRIILLEDGKIQESGTHEELMRKEGRYAEMFEIQSRYYREEGAER
ncbi:MAG: ABC transporter ATP-binding protein/permease [Roseburia sp.]|nr:ABC transporter ATP-binding protein/permease [Roseburia sp.]MCM1099506.1 ABC transporter ATP-binding protein/permease [Ruminococcus flavefaciens]